MRNAKHSFPIIFSVMAAMFVALAAVAGATDLKFHAAPGPEPVVGRYLVTLDSSVTPELAAGTASSLARTYGGQLEPYQSSDARQFAIAMLPARARGLSADQRVRDVAEIAHRDDDALAPPPSPQTATSSRHLIPLAAESTTSGTYLYDGSGNIKAIGNDTFIYDAEGRLKQAIVEGSQESYDYDPFGNRKSSVRASGAAGCIGGCDLPVTPKQESNHVEQASYDEAGNVWSMNGATYSYDGTGMVTGAIVGSDHRDFLYTADDERIAVRQGTSWTWTVRDLGGKVLREFTSFETSASPLTLTTHTWSKDYVWRDGLLLASVIPAGSGTMTYHYHVNHLGTPRLVTDQNHILVGKHTYYPFGAEMDLMPRENPIELMKFTGHERDIVASDNNSLDYMHARYCFPTVGRFLSVDPGLDLERSKQNPQEWNRYAYALNSPVGLVDPDGRQAGPASLANMQMADRRLLAQGELTPDEYRARADRRGIIGLVAAAAITGPELVGGAWSSFLLNPLAWYVAAGALMPGPGGEMPQIPVSAGNLRHIEKHLADFQKLDSKMTLSGVVNLGRSIASNVKNLVGTSGGRQEFQKLIMIGGEKVLVRVVLNPKGGLRSVHIRY